MKKYFDVDCDIYVLQISKCEICIILRLCGQTVIRSGLHLECGKLIWSMFLISEYYFIDKNLSNASMHMLGCFTHLQLIFLI